MNIMNKFVLAGFVGTALLSCNDKPESCNNEVTLPVAEFKARQYDSKGNDAPELASHDEIYFSLYARLGSYSTLTSGSINSKFRFSLFKRANALSCPRPPSSEKFSTINITSTAEYDDLHGPGDNLNDLFYTDQYSSLEEFIANQSGEICQYDCYTQIYLNSPPTLDKFHQFTFDITLDSGSSFTVTSKGLLFK